VCKPACNGGAKTAGRAGDECRFHGMTV
jgi:hypothetical protein